MNNEPDLMPEGIDPVINGSDFAEQKLNHRNAKPRPSPPTDPQHEASVNPKVQTQAELRTDPQFIADANRWYNAAYDAEQAIRSRQNSDIISQTPDGKAHEAPERLLSESEIVDWAIEGASRFNWNLTGALIDYNVMRKRPVGDVRAMMGVIDRYSASENTMDTTGRALKYLATDPLTYIGVGLVAKGVVHGGTSAAGKGYLRNLLGKAVTNPAVIGAVEGGVYTGAFASAEEDLQAKAQERDFNATIPMISTGIGVGLGAALGAAAPAIKWGWPKMVKLFRGGEKAGNSFTDSPAAAATHGPVAEHEVEVRSPAILPEVTTLDEVADHFNLDEAQTERLAAAVSDADAVDNLFERQLEALNDRLDATNEGANRALDSAQLPDAATLPGVNTPGATPLPQASLPNAAALPSGESLPGMGVGADPTLAKPTQTSLPTGGVSTIPARNNGLVGDIPVLDFEVAPNPDDIELSAAWNTLNRQEKTTITSEIADEYIPQVLERLGAKGTLEKQIGGFEGETNPGLRLVVDKPEDALRVTNALGHVLDQKSMLSTSDVPVFGYDKTGVVTLELPEGITDQEIADIYTKIYELEVDGSKIADGHTTNNGQMSILNFTDLTDDEMGEMISAHLGDQYKIHSDFVYTAFPDNKENYGYAISRTQGQTTGQSPSQGGVSDIREAAIKSRSEKISAIQASRAQAEQAVEGQTAGVVSGRTAIETSTLMQNEGVQEVLREAGADMVVYPEKSPQIQQRLNAPKNEIGMFSQVEVNVIDANVPGWKDGGAVNGQELWNKIKNSGVKQEELEWLDIEGLLTKDPKGKFTKAEVLEHIDNHRVKVEESVGANDQEFVDSENWMSEANREVDDDPANWEHITEEAVYSFDIEDTDDWIVSQFIESVELDLPNGVRRSDMELMSAEQKSAHVFSNMADEFREFAEAAAEEQYLQDPYLIIELDTNIEFGGPNPHLFIVGNDDIGWDIREGNTHWESSLWSQSRGGAARDSRPEIYSEAEAIIQAENYARESGYDMPYGSEGVRYEDYVTDGPYENYREVKLTLPDNPDSYNSPHFDEENIVSHMMVTDRNLMLDGKEVKTYFIDETQSDWHSDGRKKGYRTPDTEKRKELLSDVRFKASEERKGFIDNIFSEYFPGNGRMRYELPGLTYDDNSVPGITENKLIDGIRAVAQRISYRVVNIEDDLFKAIDSILSEEDAIKFLELDKKYLEASAEYGGVGREAPNAPFKKDAWLALTMKRALIDAAEQGYEAIAWADGTVLKNKWNIDHGTQYDKKMPSLMKRLMGEKAEHLPFDADAPLNEGEAGYWIVPVKPEVKSKVTGEGLPLFSMSSLIAGVTASMAAPYEAEAASEESSLDPDGTSMTYRVLDKSLLDQEKLGAE